MTTLADLQNAIDTLMQHPLGPGNYRLIRVVEEKAYEAYVFGLCLQAVRKLGVTPTLLGILGHPNPFVFRGAPGQIHSTRWNYGYARFMLGTEEFEIHAGVEFRGASRMTHEVDIAIMRAVDADHCRANPDDPASSSLVGAWECKFYDSALQKSLARAFVGLVDDLGTNIRATGLCSNKTHAQMLLYFQAKKRPYPHLELSPLNTLVEENFVNMVAGELKKMAMI
ncbi:MAG: hypothetical protein ACOVOP_00945 [Candidatus Planktophila sp.]|jgi:hypothetical protein